MKKAAIRSFIFSIIIIVLGAIIAFVSRPDPAIYGSAASLADVGRILTSAIIISIAATVGALCAEGFSNGGKIQRVILGTITYIGLFVLLTIPVKDPAMPTQIIGIESISHTLYSFIGLIFAAVFVF